MITLPPDLAALVERWVAPLFAAYGIGEPDEAKLRYYQLLGELF